MNSVQNGIAGSFLAYFAYMLLAGLVRYNLFSIYTATENTSRKVCPGAKHFHWPTIKVNKNCYVLCRLVCSSFNNQLTEVITRGNSYDLNQ